jgi:hypothetical protein
MEIFCLKKTTAKSKDNNQLGKDPNIMEELLEIKKKNSRKIVIDKKKKYK